MTFASESGFATMLWSKHFATQNGLRPPRFLRGAYFAVHKRQRSSLFLTAPFSSGCILAWSIVSRLLSRWNELFVPLFKQVEILISTYLSIIFPSVEIIVTCHGIIFPLSISAFFTAFSRPPQQGTSIRTISTLLMSLFLIISVSFSE